MNERKIQSDKSWGGRVVLRRRGGACFDVSVRGCGEQKLRENYFQAGQVEKCGKFISR